MKKNTNIHWFTLIELIVSIAIFGIMMISVMSIFLFSTQMSSRVELNRVMQENIKNVMEDIAENIRKWEITWWTISTTCPPSTLNASFTPFDRLCLQDVDNNLVEYFIWNKNIATGDWTPVTNISDCENFVKVADGKTENQDNICRVIKTQGTERFPLTNSFVAIEKLDFYITNDKMPKVTISMTIRPAIRKWVAPDLVKLSVVQVQTTLSKRLIETN